MSSEVDGGPESSGRAPELQVTTKEHHFGLGAPFSEAEKYQNTLQLEQEVRNQDRFISTLKLQIEDLKQTNHDLEEYVRKLLDSKAVVSSQVDDLTNHNEHLCNELIKIDQLAEQLEKEKFFVVDSANKELEEAKIEIICQQNNITVLEDTIKRLRSAQEEIARLRREMMKTCKSPKSTTAHAILRRVETERDVAFTDLRRMTTERDSLRERLKIAQETAFNEKAHLEQRIEELECTVHNLDDERMEQMSNMTLMKETITTVEKEMKSLARKAMDTESELGRQKAENNSLRNKMSNSYDIHSTFGETNKLFFYVTVLFCFIFAPAV
ncbi:testis-specific gene 10 protein-like isoform X3 [Dipodomys merriami]|uniref:testis-specific gene 10 protein-like isoform X3 n=1 Tax=Dipodomys merriami TaxID=94247 RepID=UPI00384B4ABA